MTDPIPTEARTPNTRHDQEEAPTTGIARIREKAGSTRSAATDAARRTSQSIEANPLVILVGGLAVGALAGVLIPRSEREKELLAPAGKSLQERARAAFEAARTTGQNELGDLGLTKNAARAQVRGLIDSLTTVAQNAGAAAMKSAANKG